MTDDRASGGSPPPALSEWLPRLDKMVEQGTVMVFDPDHSGMLASDIRAVLALCAPLPKEEPAPSPAGVAEYERLLTMAERDRWRSLADAYDWDRQTLSRDLDRLLLFAGTVIREHRNDGYAGDVDGGVLQDALVDAGLLAPVSVDQPCGETCDCVDYGDFPMTCLRLTALGKQAEARALLPVSPVEPTPEPE